MVLLLLLLFVSSVASIDISLTSGKLCEGAVATWTCVVDGGSLRWRNLGETGFPLSVSPNLVPFGVGSPFSSRLTSVNGSVITSIATANLTSAVNGSLLECSDGSFTLNTTTIANVTLLLEISVASTSTGLQYNQFNDNADITMKGATCVQNNINVNGDLVAMTTEPLYRYTFRCRGTYNFEVVSFDYFGNILGVFRKTYYWELYDYMLVLNFDEDENNANFTIQGLRANQPPINYCIITVGREQQSCTENVPVTFANIMSSSNTSITYNITIVNDAGVSVFINTLSGDLVVNVTHTVNNFTTVTVREQSTIGDPVIFSIPIIVLGVIAILSICWILLRICWKRQCCCPRIWRSSFWLIFFCYDCCTYDAEEKDGNTIGLKNPNVGGEKGADTSL